MIIGMRNPMHILNISKLGLYLHTRLSETQQPSKSRDSGSDPKIGPQVGPL